MADRRVGRSSATAANVAGCQLGAGAAALAAPIAPLSPVWGGAGAVDGTGQVECRDGVGSEQMGGEGMVDNMEHHFTGVFMNAMPKRRPEL